MDIHRDGNIIEAGVWFAAGAIVLWKGLREGSAGKKALLLLAPTLVIFGISDLVETRTGAWWRPWWLFAWKAVCVLAMTSLFTRYFRVTRKR